MAKKTSEKTKTSNYAFIDGQNLHYSTFKEANGSWRIDIKRFRTYLEQKYGVGKAYYFMGYQMKNYKAMYRRIRDAGYTLFFREHLGKMHSEKKGNVDVDIVFEAMKSVVEHEPMRKAIIVSGDGDYYRMVKYLIGKNKFERLLAPSEKRMSSLYKALSPKYYAFLNNPDTAKKITLKAQKKNAGSS